jgi:hypothetical protein
VVNKLFLQLKTLGTGRSKKGNSSVALEQPKHAPFLECGENPNTAFEFLLFRKSDTGRTVVGKTCADSFAAARKARPCE